jgi:hypothetical protein
VKQQGGASPHKDQKMLIELLCYLSLIFILGCVATQAENKGHIVVVVLCMATMFFLGMLAFYTSILYGIELKGVN